jgi:hypothetical protein
MYEDDDDIASWAVLEDPTRDDGSPLWLNPALIASWPTAGLTRRVDALTAEAKDIWRLVGTRLEGLFTELVALEVDFTEWYDRAVGRSSPDDVSELVRQLVGIEEVSERVALILGGYVDHVQGALDRLSAEERKRLAERFAAGSSLPECVQWRPLGFGRGAVPRRTYAPSPMLVFSAATARQRRIRL